MNKGDYIPTLDDMVEEDYRDKIIQIFCKILADYLNDEKTNLITDYDFSNRNSIISYRKIRDKNGKLKKITNNIVIIAEYEKRDKPLFKNMTVLNISKKIRNIKNGITIKLPFCKVELCLSGYESIIETFLDVIVTSSDDHKEFYSIDIKEIIGNNYDPEEYSATRGGEYDWQFRFINSLFSKTRDIIKKHHKDDKYMIESYDHVFRSISLSVLQIFKVIYYKFYKD